MLDSEKNNVEKDGPTMKDGEEEEVVTVPIRQSARIAARHAPTEVVAEVVADTTPVAPRASITD